MLRHLLSPLLGDGLPDQFIPGGPDLAVEILSASSRWPEVEETLADYFASGARIVWVVEPRERRVMVSGAVSILFKDALASE